jgi:tRNA/tmRNA/rRNA uracil-C5-methylase (TrmA/RlmC/RlmD family)
VGSRREEVRIGTIAFGGEGVGRIGDKVVFVPFTAAGDTVRVEITEERKRYLRGVPLEILDPGPERRTPPCPLFGRCGGCDYQHLSPSEQLAVKERQVREVFQRIGRIPDPPVLPIVPSPEVFHYRGKGEYHLRRGKGGNPVLGFMDVRGGTVIAVSRCLLMDDSINEAANRFLGDVLDVGAEFPEGRYVFWSGGEEGSPGLPFPSVKRLVKGVPFLVPREGFFQANLFLAGTLVDEVLAAGEWNACDSVLDGYCGSGLFSLFLAPRVARVTGVDSDGMAVRAARVNALAQGLDRVLFLEGTAEDTVRDLHGRGVCFDAVLLDPPRAGCGRSLLEILADIPLREIVYVSCNPATQARDVVLLRERGFRLASLRPLDMFPQTKHVEVIARLTRS